MAGKIEITGHIVIIKSLDAKLQEWIEINEVQGLDEERDFDAPLRAIGDVAPTLLGDVHGAPEPLRGIQP